MSMARLDSINDFRIFEAVARTGSLSAAAREMDLSLTMVSRRLKRIEQVLLVRLVQRTTRRLALTAEGEQFAERARAVIAAAAEAEETGAAGMVRGVVRVTATVAFAQRQLAPRLPRFLDRYPDVEVQVVNTDRLMDLVSEKVDFAFRQAPLGDGRLITRTIAQDALLLVASPAYARKAGLPAHPSELSAHPALTVGDPPPRLWTLFRGNERQDVPLRSVASGMDGEIAHAAALAGGGIAMKASWDVIDDIRAGRLLRVLPEWWGPPRMLRIVFPMRGYQPRRVRVLIDFMETELRAAARIDASLGVFPTETASGSSLAAPSPAEPVLP